MGKNTGIQWAHHTFNPWRGCSKISEGCANCYAEVLSHKKDGLGEWGPNARRSVASEKYWNYPIQWNREAELSGERARVFCASLADVFEERDDLEEHRKRLFELIKKTPHLDWLLLTKRSAFANEWLHRYYGSSTQCKDDGTISISGKPLPNVWLGVSVENQEAADLRIPDLLTSPAVCRFLSCEPLIGPVDLCRLSYQGGVAVIDSLRGLYGGVFPHAKVPAVDWVIVGGESGEKARPCHIEWITDIKDQCEGEKDRYLPKPKTKVFVKQLGINPWHGDPAQEYPITSKKGEDVSEFPWGSEDIQQVPRI